MGNKQKNYLHVQCQSRKLSRNDGNLKDEQGADLVVYKIDDGLIFAVTGSEMVQISMRLEFPSNGTQ